MNQKKANGIVVGSFNHDNDSILDDVVEIASNTTANHKVTEDVVHNDKSTYLCHVLSLVLRNLQRSQTLNQ